MVEPYKPQTTMWRIRIACWINKATDASSEYVILFAFYGNNGYRYAPERYVIGTLPVWFKFNNSIDVKNMSYARNLFFSCKWLRSRRWRQQYLHFTRLKPSLLPQSTVKTLSSSPRSQIV